MRFGVFLCCLLGWIACDKVLGLQERPAVPDALLPNPAECPQAPLDPFLDEDADGDLNGADPCPRHAFQTSNNEDGADQVDDCDLCPKIASREETGADPDCDGIGAACDPDSAVLHDRRFHGFGGGSEIEFADPSEDGVVRDGAVHMMLTNDNGSSIFNIPTAAPLAGLYEVAGSITNATSSTYWTVSISVETLDKSQRYELELERNSSQVLAAAVQLNGVDVAGSQRMFVGPTTPVLTFYLRADITNGSLAGLIRVNNESLVVPRVSLPPLGEITRYGFRVVRDPDQVNSVPIESEVVTEYYSYTTPRP